jgi:hypothetical protein
MNSVMLYYNIKNHLKITQSNLEVVHLLQPADPISGAKLSKSITYYLVCPLGESLPHWQHQPPPSGRTKGGPRGDCCAAYYQIGFQIFLTKIKQPKVTPKHHTRMVRCF